jgi:hypothetical protein
MRRSMIYSIIGLVLGLSVIMVPILALAEIRRQDSPMTSNSFSEKFIEGPDSNAPTFSSSDIWFLSICFVVALVAYMLFRSRMPEREHRMVGHIPY